MRVLITLLLFFIAGPLFADPPEYKDKTNLLVWKDSGGKEHPIRTAEDWARRRQHILDNMQLVMGKLPDATKKVDFDAKVLESKDFGTYQRVKLTIAVEKDDRL